MQTPPDMPQRASAEVGPLTKAMLFKNMASLGCPKGTTGVPTSNLLPSPSPQSYTPAAALKWGGNESHASRDPPQGTQQVSRLHGRHQAKPSPAQQDIPAPLSQGSLPHPGGSGLQPVVQILSPTPDGEASWDTGLLEVRVPLSLT